MKYDLIIFDLDGTLLDTLDDLAQAANHALTAAGFPERTRDDIRRFIGNGVARLIRLSAPEGTPEETLSAMLADFKAFYTTHVNDHTLPYPGVPELLADLKKAGAHVAMNSNKLDSAVQLLCAAHLPGLLEIALGERTGIPKKPDPAGALAIMARIGAAPERTLYVGDGDTDILTARNAGVDSAWVSWGYRHAEELGALTPDHRFDTLEQLRHFLLEA